MWLGKKGNKLMTWEPFPVLSSLGFQRGGKDFCKEFIEFFYNPYPNLKKTSKKAA